MSERRLVVAVLAIGTLAPPASAWATNDEATNLRARRSGASAVELTWEAPVVLPDSYQVRRCPLASVNVPSAGNCIAEGLPLAPYVDPDPVGNVFYLVSGEYGTTEGSLGDRFDGAAFAPRTADPCGTPPGGGPITVVVTLLQPASFCGSDIRITYPLNAIAYQSSACTGVQSGMGQLGGERDPGAYLACYGSNPVAGSGEVARFDLVVGSCPIDPGDVRIAHCEFFDCDSGAGFDLPCSVSF